MTTRNTPEYEFQTPNPIPWTLLNPHPTRLIAAN